MISVEQTLKLILMCKLVRPCLVRPTTNGGMLGGDFGHRQHKTAATNRCTHLSNTDLSPRNTYTEALCIISVQPPGGLVPFAAHHLS